MKITFVSMLIRNIFLVSILFFSSSCAKNLRIAGDGESEYHIVLPQKADITELKAASLLQRHIQVAAGVKLPIMRDREPQSPYEICLGITNRDSLVYIKNQVKPEPEGYRIKSSGEKLFIYGGSSRGTLNGVTSFLEDYLGIRVYSSTVQLSPVVGKFKIPASIDKTYNPPIVFRTIHYRDSWKPAYADWHKLSHGKDGSHPDWGYWCHSFNTLVPPEQYFREHPEYYAEINGSRFPAQLCLTNPDVFEITVSNLRKAMEASPELTYWSVSQNDNVSYCQCEECKKIDDKEGTPMGSLLTFINRVAAEFQDKVISTLAYQYSRNAPKNIKPADNVNIMLCTIEMNRSIPIRDDPSSASFRKDLEDWAALTDDILLWDYVIQFENLVSPFPNLRVLQPNLQYFLENHADKHFQQGNREVGGEFAELRAYMIAKLLWDPYIDVNEVMDDFLDGYYGKAGKYIGRYINDMHDELEKSGQHLSIFGHPSDASRTWLSMAKMKDYGHLFDLAEKSVRDDPEILERVKIARMPLEYAKVEIAQRLGTAPGGMYQKDGSGKWIVREDIKASARSLVDLAIKQGVTRFKEWHTTPPEYLLSLEKSWELDMQDHLALDKAPVPEFPPSEKYAGGNINILTDGLRGPRLTFAYNWLGFEGNECDIVIDFGEPVEMHSISSSWLNDMRSWIFLPEKVGYYGSVNGQEWINLGEVINDLDPQSPEVVVRDFSYTLEDPVKFKYLRVKTESFLRCPEWHPGSSAPAWIFVDEIIVK